MTSLRLDLEGIGDSDGDEELFDDVAHFHGEQFFAQTRAALDALEGAGLGNRFILVGLCSGAYWAFHAALADDRVAAALMINPEGRSTGMTASRSPASCAAPACSRNPSPGSASCRGDVSLARWATMVAVARRRARPVRRVVCARRQERHAERGTTRSPPRSIVCSDRDLRARFVFCDGEPLFEELTRAGLLDRPDRWPTVSVAGCPVVTTRCARCGCTSMSLPQWTAPSTRSCAVAAVEVTGSIAEPTHPLAWRNSSVWAQRNFVGSYASRALRARPRSCCFSATRSRSPGESSSSGAVRGGSRVPRRARRRGPGNRHLARHDRLLPEAVSRPGTSSSGISLTSVDAAGPVP